MQTIFDIRSAAYRELARLRCEKSLTDQDKNSLKLNEALLKLSTLKIQTESEIVSCRCCAGRLIPGAPCRYSILFATPNHKEIERPASLSSEVCPTCWFSYCSSYSRSGTKDTILFASITGLRREHHFNRWLTERFIPNILKRMERNFFPIRCQGTSYTNGSGNDVNCANWASKEIDGNYVCNYHVEKGILHQPNSIRELKFKKHAILLTALELAIEKDPSIIQSLNELIDLFDKKSVGIQPAAAE